MIELLSYNTHLGKRINEINGWVSSLPHRPDIVCYQELPATQTKTTESSFPSSYRSEFAPGVIVGTEFGEQTIYDSSKLSLVNSQVVDLGLPPLERMISHSGNRSALVTAFEIEGHEFIVANVHLSWFATHRRRREQIGAIIEAIGPQETVLIVGDFNYSSIMRGSGLAKFLRDEGFEPAGGKFITHRLLGIGHQVDYVFQRNCNVLEVTAGKIDLSDHAPIFVKFEVGQTL